VIATDIPELGELPEELLMANVTKADGCKENKKEFAINLRKERGGGRKWEANPGDVASLGDASGWGVYVG